MNHAIHRVERFDIVGPYTLCLEFEDGARQEIDFRPVLEGQVLGALQDVALFNAVRLDAETGVLRWPNGADFDPETLRPSSSNVATAIYPSVSAGPAVPELGVESSPWDS